METKICTKCKKEKPATKDFFSAEKKGKHGLNSKCKVCRSKAHKDWCFNNPDKVKASWTEWKKNNIERVRETDRRYRNKNINKRRQSTRKADANSVKNLSDRYIKQLILNQIGVPFSEITSEMVEMRRLIVKLNRKIKQKQY